MFGCADVRVTSNSIVRRHEDTSVVTCLVTGQTHVMTCVDGHWIGDPSVNCSKSELLHWLIWTSRSLQSPDLPPLHFSWNSNQFYFFKRLHKVFSIIRSLNLSLSLSSLSLSYTLSLSLSLSLPPSLSRVSPAPALHSRRPLGLARYSPSRQPAHVCPGV